MKRQGNQSMIIFEFSKLLSLATIFIFMLYTTYTKCKLMGEVDLKGGNGKTWIKGTLWIYRDFCFLPLLWIFSLVLVYFLFPQNLSFACMYLWEYPLQIHEKWFCAPHLYPKHYVSSILLKNSCKN